MMSRLQIDRRLGVSLIAVGIESALFLNRAGFAGGNSFLSGLHDASWRTILLDVVTVVFLLVLLVSCVFFILQDWSWEGFNIPWKALIIGYFGVKSISIFGGLLPTAVQYPLNLSALVAAGLSLPVALWIQVQVWREAREVSDDE